jgi:hypothetical protein
MFPRFRLAATVAVSSLVLAGPAGAAAGDLRSPDAVDAASSPAQDFRSPDAVDAGDAARTTDRPALRRPRRRPPCVVSRSA